MHEARRHLRPILLSGGVVGLALGLTVTVVTRAHAPWFALSLSIVIGVMMVAYVAVPARLIGIDSGKSRAATGSRRASSAPPSAPWSAPPPTCSAGSAC